MSKKDYQAIARAIYSEVDAWGGKATTDEKSSYAVGALLTLAEELSDIFKADNPAFDRARFIEACETGTTKGMPKRSVA